MGSFIYNGEKIDYDPETLHICIMDSVPLKEVHLKARPLITKFAVVTPGKTIGELMDEKDGGKSWTVKSVTPKGWTVLTHFFEGPFVREKRIPTPPVEKGFKRMSEHYSYGCDGFGSFGVWVDVEIMRNASYASS